ncbi:MAG: CRISPR-associated endonuclease Cas2 [Desulfovibrio sp.]|jgi:CRISPR-associated protein Cas2|nr:CRISPR-associated endonuclease Cas2 [Desulfovibrio sp.]
MPRTLFLVCYDISGQNRLHRVHNCVKAYAVGGQKSFYECWMTPAEYRALQRKLEQLANLREDTVHFFQLDPRMHPLFYGQAKRRSTQPFMIV